MDGGYCCQIADLVVSQQCSAAVVYLALSVNSWPFSLPRVYKSTVTVYPLTDVEMSILWKPKECRDYSAQKIYRISEN
jgi:hypothetical protein